MNESRGATGMQIAFLVFAVLLLGAPVERYVLPLFGWTGDYASTTARLVVFVPGIVALLAFPNIRHRCLADLRVGIPRECRAEVAVVSVVHLLVAAAGVGGVVLWYWLLGGDMSLARRLGMQATAESEWERALSTDGILHSLILGGIVAPVVEELVFRGFLYRAWEAQWGWFRSMLATSTVFAIYHPNFVSAFLGAVVLTCVLRRTGSIVACIVVHATFNIAMWYPLLGQFVFRTAGRQTGELALWSYHLAALAVSVVIVALYIWLSRDTVPSADEDFDEACAARP